MEKIRVCVCGKLFTPEKRGQIRCLDCQQGARTARPFRCDIIEVRADINSDWEGLDSPYYGRCSGYMHGICEKCLDYCEKNNWTGWKALGFEWWTGIITIERNKQ